MIEKYVVSLDLAKKLKEAGWKKETVYWWVKTQHGIRLEAIRYIELYPNQSYGIIWLDDAGKEEFMPLAPAPLAEEILEELPFKILTKSGEFYLTVETGRNKYYYVGYKQAVRVYDYWWEDRWLHFLSAEIFTNALARLWLWLKENGYLEEKDEAGKNL